MYAHAAKMPSLITLAFVAAGTHDVAAMSAALGMPSAVELDRVLQWYATQGSAAP